ncbi:MAG: SDR family NAD(P)-dependent oxidoreductase [Bacilli bacterium]|nr:SDR family NAD(P)-dependent oxidoreductase [Bacilli bacterium]
MAIDKGTFKGIIIKNSITDYSLLNYLESIAKEVYEHKLGGKHNTIIYKIEVPKDKVDELSIKLSKSLYSYGYYIHFVSEKEMIVIFPNKIFKFSEKDNDIIDECILYGESINIDSKLMKFREMFYRDHPNDKNVLIFGGSGDLGKEFSDVFLQNDYNVYSTYKTSKMDYSNIEQYYYDALADNKDFFEKIKNIAIDVLVFCVGARSSKKEVVDTDYDEFMNLLTINALSFLKIYKELAINLRRNNSKVLVVSSSASLENKVTNGAYSSSKAYLDSIVETLKKEEEKYGVEFKLIHPSLFKSKLAEEIVRMKGYDNLDYYVENVLDGDIKSTKDIVNENIKYLGLKKK